MGCEGQGTGALADGGVPLVGITNYEWQIGNGWIVCEFRYLDVTVVDKPGVLGHCPVVGSTREYFFFDATPHAVICVLNAAGGTLEDDRAVFGVVGERPGAGLVDKRELIAVQVVGGVIHRLHRLRRRG